MSSFAACDRALRNSLQASSQRQTPKNRLELLMQRQTQSVERFWASSPKVLLPYQQRWIADKSRIKVCEKSRRIGISWADAADAAIEASRANGASVFYLGFNKEMSEQYVRDVAEWAKAFSLAASAVEEFLFDDSDEDGDRSILAFRVRFASGHQVVALSSRPKNLRSKKGHIRIDEAAFHDDLDELLKAAIAILMWGGSVAIWSTHNGVDNPFNKIVKKIQAKELAYSLHRYTLQDAIAQGLYKRICLINGERWTLEKEFEWERQLRKDYGIAALEELDVVPFAGGEGSVFSRQWFNPIEPEMAPKNGMVCRAWDLAATARELATDLHYYTASCKMIRLGDRFTVAHATWNQVAPSEIEDLIVKTAQADGQRVMVQVELEGGSGSRIFADGLQRRLRQKGFNITFESPSGDKLTRAIPFSTAAMNNQVDIVRGAWAEQYLDALIRFDGSKIPLVNDLTDSSSAAFNFLSNRSPSPPPKQPAQRNMQQSRVFGGKR